MDITIKASDGRRFNGTVYEDLVNEVNAYESDLKLKKEKAEAERKAKEEAEKKLVEEKDIRIKAIGEKSKELNQLIKSFESDYKNNSLYVQYDSENGFTVKAVDGTIGDLFSNIVKSYRFWN